MMEKLVKYCIDNNLNYKMKVSVFSRHIRVTNKDGIKQKYWNMFNLVDGGDQLVGFHKVRGDDNVLVFDNSYYEKKYKKSVKNIRQWMKKVYKHAKSKGLSKDILITFDVVVQTYE